MFKNKKLKTLECELVQANIESKKAFAELLRAQTRRENAEASRIEKDE